MAPLRDVTNLHLPTLREDEAYNGDETQQPTKTIPVAEETCATTTTTTLATATRATRATPVSAVDKTDSRQTNVFETLPNVQCWLKDGHDNDLVSFLNDNPGWLDGVLDELIRVIPVGSMSVSIWKLGRVLLTNLSRHGSKHAVRLAMVLFRRLLQEEDCTVELRLPAVVYGRLMRAQPTKAVDMMRLVASRHQMRRKGIANKAVVTTSNKVAVVLSLLRNKQIDDAQDLLWETAPIGLCNAVLYAQPDTDRADQLLSRLERNLLCGPKQTTRLPQPTVLSFEVMIEKHVSSPMRAEAVMERLLVWCESVPSLQPTTCCFSAMLRAWRHNPAKVSLWMERLQSRFGPSPSVSTNVDEADKDKRQISSAVDRDVDSRDGSLWIATYRCHIGQIRQYANFGFAEKVEQILVDLVRCDMAPPQQCWLLAVRCWLSSGDTGGAQRIAQLAPRDVSLCNRVLQAWSKTNPDKAQAFYEWMDQELSPNTATYGYIVSAWYKSGSDRAGVYVQQVLASMVVRKRPVTARILGMAMTTLRSHQLDRWLWEGLTDRQKHVVSDQSVTLLSPVAQDILAGMTIRPTHASLECLLVPPRYGSVTSNAVLAVSLSNNTDRAHHISRCAIRHMAASYSKGDRGAIPKAGMFMRLFARLHEARETVPPKAAMGLMDAVVPPDDRFGRACLLYSLTVCGWSRHPDSARCADLLWMEHFVGKSIHRECVHHLRACRRLVLKAFTNHPRVFWKRAEELLLSEMVECGEAGRQHGDQHQQGNHKQQHNGDKIGMKKECLLVLECIAKSRHSDSARMALDFSRRHSILSRSWVFFASAYSRPAQYSVALEAFRDLRREGIVPSTVDYFRFLSAAVLAAPDARGRIGMASSIFRECHRDNRVDERMLKRVWGLVPSDVRRGMVGHDRVSVDDLLSMKVEV